MKTLLMTANEVRTFLTSNEGSVRLPRAVAEYWGYPVVRNGSGPYGVLRLYLKGTPTIAHSMKTGDWPDMFLIPSGGHAG